MVEELFGADELISKKGKMTPMEATNKVKIVGMLFAKNGCPFTNDMVKSLSDIYNKLNQYNKILEIIYCQGGEVSYCGLDEDE